MRRIALLLPLLVMIFGLAAEVREHLRERADRGLVFAKGSFWSALDSSGRPVALESDAGQLILASPAVMHVGAANATREIRLGGRPTESIGKIGFHYVARDARHLRVEIEPFGPVVVVLTEDRGDLGALPLSSETIADLAGRDKTLDYRLRFDADLTRVFVAGRQILEAPPAESVGSVFAEGCRFALGSIGHTDTAGLSQDDDLRSLKPVSAVAIFLETLAPIALMHLIAMGWLFALSMGRPTTWKVGFAALVGLFLWNASSVLGAMGFPTVSRALQLLSPLAVMPALFVIRGTLRGESPSPTRPRRIVVTALLCGITAYGASTMMHGALTDRRKAELASVAIEQMNPPDPRVPSGPITDVGFTLDPRNHRSFSGSFRDFELTADIELGDGAVLEVRSRAEDDSAIGVAAFVSANEGFRTGIYEEGHVRFRPLDVGLEATPVSSRTVHNIRFLARGRKFQLVVDGAPVANGSSATYPRGGFALLAAQGVVDVRNLHIEPATSSEADVPSPMGRSLLAGAAPILFLALLCGLLLPRRSYGVGGWATIEASSFSLVPLAWLVFSSDSASVSRLNFAVAMAGSVFILLVVASIHRRDMGRLRFLLIATVALVGSFLTQEAVTLPTPLPRDPAARTAFLNGLSHTDTTASSMHPDFLHLQHPLIRRFNPYLVDHRFRDRNLPPEPLPAAGVEPSPSPMVVCLGSSSTYGYLLPDGSGEDYPAQLERRLVDDGEIVQVWNAGWSGATAARVYWFLRNVVAPLRPAVVTLSVYYNDAVVLSQGDEGRWFGRLASEGTSPLEKLIERAGAQRDRGVFEAAQALFEDRREGSRDVWLESGGDADDTPPDRFERTLRRFADLAEQEGFELVLIKEAIAGNRPRIWKDEFRAAIDRVADDHSLVVCDPTYVLLQAERRLEEPVFMDEVHLYPVGCSLMAWSLAPHVKEALRRRENAESTPESTDGDGS